jgi:hypothetical protein
LLDTAWDAVHAAKGSPILPMAAYSSTGCAVCDPVIALWYFAGAPSVPELLRSRRGRAGRTAVVTADSTNVPATVSSS